MYDPDRFDFMGFVWNKMKKSFSRKNYVEIGQNIEHYDFPKLCDKFTNYIIRVIVKKIILCKINYFGKTYCIS